MPSNIPEAWVAVGLVVACWNDFQMQAENEWSRLERSISFIRAVLAWPTYLAEDVLNWWVEWHED